MTAKVLALPTATPSIAAFMAAAPAPLNGNSDWASRYAAQLRAVVHEHATNSPRNLQVHLGPSELGTLCDRRIVSRLVREPRTNHVVDPWASVVGTAVHAWLADAFRGDNTRHGLRWVPEQRVYPHADHSGTADLYDAVEQAVVDHKILGKTTHVKIKDHGPPMYYRIQLYLYALGYRNLGLPVRRVALAAFPRTEHTLRNLYVWEHELTSDDDEIIASVFELTSHRRALADEVRRGRPIASIPFTASDDECFFCPFYRPEVAHDGGPGCPGPRASQPVPPPALVCR